jgi:hypothetical protein
MRAGLLRVFISLRDAIESRGTVIVADQHPSA